MKLPTFGSKDASRHDSSERARGLRLVRHVVAVASGKGGVGKTTVAVNLALALAQRGHAVGLMDADVYGPSVPAMLGGHASPEVRDDRLYPIERFGVRFISMALLTDARSPVIWRGPMATKLITAFLEQVDWGQLDYLLVDLPPGTGDVQLTLAQQASLSGGVIVTTPQDLAVGVTVRGARMFEEVGVPILGVIENMSGFRCPHCGGESEIFSKGGAERMAQASGYPFLGRIPLDPQLSVAWTGSAAPSVAEPFGSIAQALEKRVEEAGRAVSGAERPTGQPRT